MSKKPKLGGTVQISGKQYVVLAAPARYGDWFRILVMNKDAGSYWAQSEGWRCGCGPWKIMQPQPAA